MSISTKVCPDDDPLVQVMLRIDLMQRKLSGINSDRSAAYRSMESLQELQHLCFEVGRETSEALSLPVNTKFHRIMRHIIDHFVSFGCIRRGATDDNESLHTLTKKAYSSTNQHLAEIAPQLLSSRAALQRDAERDDDSSATETQLLLSRNAISSTPSHEALSSSGRLHNNVVADLNNFISINNSKSNTEMEKSITELQHQSSLTLVWNKIKSARFHAILPWMPAYKVVQTVYSGENIYGTQNRKDTAVYWHNGRQEYGIIQAILTHMSVRESRVLLLRRLRQVGAEPGNVKVVDFYGHKRFGYLFGEEDIELVAVNSESLIRSAILIPVPYLVSRVYGSKQIMSQLPDTVESRKVIRFFEVTGYKFTSLAEHSH